MSWRGVAWHRYATIRYGRRGELGGARHDEQVADAIADAVPRELAGVRHLDYHMRSL